MGMPKATVLHNAGWITQIPQALHIAVEQRRSYVQITGCQLHPKPLAWFKAVTLLQPSQAAFTTHGLRTLPPAWALADLQADPHAWHPDPDDLDIPQGSAEPLQTARAVLRTLGPVGHLRSS